MQWPVTPPAPTSRATDPDVLASKAKHPNMNRAFELSPPLGGETLLFHRMTAREELGRLSEYEIDALSANGELDPDEILGKPVTVKEKLADGSMRPFNGHIARFGQTGFHGRHHVYRLVVRPWLWFLTRTANCRIFQQMTVPDILKQVFNHHADVANNSFELTGHYSAWEYCVQYRESDFDFVSRLMEHEGIYYYFRHADDKHTLVLTDDSSMHSPAPGCEQLPFILQEREDRTDIECIDTWRFDREIQPARFAHDNYDPEKPRVELERSASVERRHAQGSYEIYDYPASHTVAEDGEHYARLRLQELHARYETSEGRTNARGLAVGHLFELTRHPRPDQNREYLVSAARYEISDEGHESGNSSGALYTCHFTTLQSRQSFRPQRRTPKPIVQGPQTAVVVGPPGEEIHTDHQGRVKVRFHWDRYSAGDETSSCWIRVSQPWAGKGWGGVSIPRIGQEVIVDFLEGDPDRPIITGRVYNAEQTPPYALPGMVSGLKSQTHKGTGHNEMSMDDTAGQEKLTLHGQYDMHTTVGHDQTNTIKNNRTTTVVVDDALNVNANRTMHVKGKLSETIDTGQEVTVTSGYTETITHGATSTITGGLTSTVNGEWNSTVNGHLTETVTSGMTLTVTDGFTETVSGTRDITITGPMSQSASQTMDLHAQGAGTYTSATSLTLAVPGSTIELTQGTITISAGGSTIKVDASGVSVNGTKISLNC